MATQTARVTFLTSPDFKMWLGKEASDAGISISEFIRLRCQSAPSEDELILSAMVTEVRKATKRASASLDKGLKDAAAALKEMRQGRSKN